MRKKFGFTLYEILICLMIIGFLSAIAFSTIKIQDYKEKAEYIMANKTIELINQASSQMLIAETDVFPNHTFMSEAAGSGTSSSDTFLGKTSSVSSSTDVANLFAQYIKNDGGVINFCDHTKVCTDSNIKGFKVADGSYIGFSKVGVTNCAIYRIPGDDTDYAPTKKCWVTVYIDTNGTKGPSTYGKDYFKYGIDATGIVNSNSEPKISISAAASATPTECGAGMAISGTGCVPCEVENCLNYSSGCNCGLCGPGYQASGALCSACSDVHCDSFSSGCTCQTCTNGYSLSDGSCNVCNVAHCLNYTTNTCTCSQCANGYTKIGDICNQDASIAGCNTYNSTKTSCETCDSTYFKAYNNSNIVGSSQNPSASTTGYTCILKSTIPNCSSYDTNGCATCNAGYEKVSNSSLGSDFISELGTKINVCKPCNISLCSTYSSGCSCSSCNSGYCANTSSNVCSAKPDNCSTCNNTAGICASCDSGYCLNTSTNKCSAKPDNCSTCNNTAGTCESCNSGYCLNTSTNSCSTKPDNCSTCNNTTGMCATCNAGYQVSNGSCVSCGVPQCTGYSSGCTCSSCNAGYKVSNGSCVACGVSQCTGYSSGCTCSSCNAGYQVSGGKCILACSAGYKLSNGSCVACGVSGCTSYSSGCTCSSCSTYYTVSGGSCVVSTYNCLGNSNSKSNCVVLSGSSVKEFCSSYYQEGRSTNGFYFHCKTYYNASLINAYRSAGYSVASRASSYSDAMIYTYYPSYSLEAYFYVGEGVLYY